MPSSRHARRPSQWRRPLRRSTTKNKSHESTNPLLQVLESAPNPEEGANTTDYIRLLIENSTDIFTVIDQDAIIRFESHSVERVLGYRPEELVGKKISEYIHPEDSISQFLQYTAQETGVPKCAEFRFRHQDGSWRFLEAVGRAVIAGPRVYAVINSRDISDRKQAEQTLLESQTRLAAIVDSAMDAVITVDADQRITLFNAAAERMFGRSAAEMVGQPLDLVIPQRYVEAHRVRVDSFGQTNSTTRSIGRLGVLYGVRASGEEFPVEISISQAEIGGKKTYAAIVRDITERRRAEAELQESEKSYRHLFENNPQPMWVYDLETLAFLEVNEAAVRRYGYSREQFLAMTIKDIRPPENVPALLENVATTRTVFDEAGTWRHLKRDGTPMDVDIVSHAMTYGGRPARLVLASDVTARKRAEAEIGRRAGEFAALYETARDLATVRELQPILQTIVERAAALLDAASGSVFLYNAARQDLEIAVAKGMELSIGTRFQLGEGMAGRVAQTHEPLIVDDYRAWDLRSPQMGDIPIASSIAVPMLYGGELIGVLTANEVGDTSHRFTDADARLLSLLASSAASAVHNARLLEETERRAEQLALLYEVGLTLNSVLDPDSQLESLSSGTLKALRGDRVEFALYDEARNELVIASGSGYTPEGLAAVRGRRFQMDNNRVISWVARNRRPLSIPDVTADSRWIVFDPQIRSGLWVPVEHENRLLGVLGILAVHAHAFTEQDERLLLLFASQAAVALENGRLFEETTRRLGQIRALHTIDQAIGGSLDLRFTLNLFLEQAMNQLNVHAADILVLDPRTRTLEFTAGRGFRTKALGQTRLRLGEGHAGRAALERQTVAIPKLSEAESEFHRSPLFAQEQFVSYYAVPLRAKGQVKGVLEIFHRAMLEPNQEWLDFLETLAGQAAIAIDNAELFDDLQRSNVELALAYDTTIESWSRALDLRDKETEGHTQRVTDLTLRLGRALGMSEAELVHVRRGGLLHDIGKMGIPDSILLKPGPLTDEEWDIMRSHPEHAYQLLSPISYLRPALDIPYCHHEWWNGMGYPRRLKGEEIPLAARVFAVVDVWDALLSHRPYRGAWDEDRVRGHIRSESDSHFDPKVVEAFFGLLDSPEDG